MIQAALIAAACSARISYAGHVGHGRYYPTREGDGMSEHDEHDEGTGEDKAKKPDQSAEEIVVEAKVKDEAEVKADLEAKVRAEIEAKLRAEIEAKVKAEMKPIILPKDMTEDEKKDFERTGTLELYDLNREADKIARERIENRQRLAEIARIEEDKAAKRAQIELERASLERERALLSLPPPAPSQFSAGQSAVVNAPAPQAPPRRPQDGVPLRGSEQLPEVVKGVLRRLFGYGSHEWSAENQQGLVNLLLAMGPAKSQQWAYQLKDALASDAYYADELSPRALLKGATGLKQIAGPVMPELRQLAGSSEELKQLADSQGRRKKKRRKDGTGGKKGKIRLDAERVEDRHHHVDDGSEEEVIDDSPHGGLGDLDIGLG